MTPSTRLILALTVQMAAGIGFLACGGGGDDGEEPKTSGDDGKQTDGQPSTPGKTDTPATPSGALKFNFAQLYSAYDGKHKFQVPVSVVGSSGASFEPSDPSKVDVTKTDEGATLTTLAAGKVTIKGTLGSQSGSVELNITEATPEDWEAGNARYNSGIPAFRLDGGVPSSMASAQNFLDKRGACTSCHGDTASFLKVQHTPLQVAGYSDEELLTIITMGQKPAGALQRTMFPAQYWGMGHRWDLNEAERKGIVVYLRSLAPTVQNEFDVPVRAIVDGGFILRDGGFVPFPDGGVARP